MTFRGRGTHRASLSPLRRTAETPRIRACLKRVLAVLLRSSSNSSRATRCRAIPLIASVLGLCGCDAAGRALSTLGVCGEGEAGVRQVPSSTPVQWTTTPELREIWRFPPADEDPLLFPVSVAVSHDGTAAVSDVGRGAMLLDASGTSLAAGTYGAAASGALIAPVAAAWAGDRTLMVWDLESGDVVTSPPGGPTSRRSVPREFRDAILEGGDLIRVALRLDGSVLAVRGRGIGRGATGLELRREELLLQLPDASAATTVVADTVETVEGWPRGGSVALTIASSPAGALAVADPSGAYRIRLTTSEGEELILCRDEPGLPVTPAELGEEAPARWRNLATALAAAGPVEHPTAIGRLFFDAQERLWVQRERPRPYGDTDRLHGVPGATYDVFAANGTLLGSIAAPQNARLQTALGDIAWSLESEPDGTFRIAAYVIVD